MISWTFPKDTDTMIKLLSYMMSSRLNIVVHKLFLY